MPEPNGKLATVEGAGFAAHAASDNDDGPLVVHGIALPEDEVVSGTNAKGEKSYYPPGVLEEAAEALRGRKLVDDTEHDDLEALQPPNEAIIGDVTDARYRPGVGVVYQGEIDREPERSLVENGRVDVSPALFRAEGDFDDDLDARRVEKIGHWRDLAVVPEGAADSASIQPGTMSPAEALQAEALADTFDESGAHAGGGGGTNPDNGESPGRDMPDPENKDDPSIAELRDRIDALETERDELREQVDEDKDETIDDLRDRISALEDENASLEETAEPVESAAAEAMAEKTGLPEDVVREKFGTDEMLESLTEGDDQPDSVAEALSLTPNPETGDPDPTDPGGDGGGLADLSNDERDEVESLLARADTFEGTNDQIAESLRSDAADLADVEDADELVGEVL